MPTIDIELKDFVKLFTEPHRPDSIINRAKDFHRQSIASKLFAPGVEKLKQQSLEYAETLPSGVWQDRAYEWANSWAYEVKGDRINLINKSEFALDFEHGNRRGVPPSSIIHKAFLPGGALSAKK